MTGPWSHAMSTMSHLPGCVSLIRSPQSQTGNSAQVEYVDSASRPRRNCLIRWGARVRLQDRRAGASLISVLCLCEALLEQLADPVMAGGGGRVASFRDSPRGPA